jgi:hypothetical protein
MEAKLKALELVEAMAFSCRECDYEAKAKQCALIAVDEIIFALSFHSDTELGEEYWVEVKQEIENL